MIYTNGTIRHRRLAAVVSGYVGKFTNISGVIPCIQSDFVSTLSKASNGGLSPKARYKICSDEQGARVLTTSDWVTLTIKETDGADNQYCRATFTFTPEIKVAAAQVLYIFIEFDDYDDADADKYVAHVMDWWQPVNQTTFGNLPYARIKFFTRVEK